jgi:A/G-specific adenine glycosylase
VPDPTAIRRALLAWYRRAARALPWRATRDPYRIWVSEIMLQQTRAAAVVPYYRRFLRAFPNVERLAQASEEELLRIWSGLGYYQRARHMHRAARRILELGRFPREYDSIRALPGVGDYTAAAVASIAFNLPYAVLDGNVMRVLARLLAEQTDVRSRAAKARLRQAAETLLDPKRPGDFNQALMELGATVCLPRNPRCGDCPLQAWCRARRMGLVNRIPAKRRREAPRPSQRTLLLIERNGSLLLKRRSQPGQLQGFFELPEPADLPAARPGPELGRFHHAITNRRYLITVRSARAVLPEGPFLWAPEGDLRRLPLTTATRKALALRSKR